MKIALIDDDAPSLSELAKFLEYESHVVTPFSSAESGLQKIAPETFDIVISDVVMPQMSGLDLLRKIREKHKDLPVLLMSGKAEIIDILRVMTTDGSASFLAKPVQTRELLDLAEKLVRHRQDPPTSKAMLADYLSDKDTILLSDFGFDPADFFIHEKIGSFFIGSDKMRGIYRILDRLLEFWDLPVLIEGETGTGKEAIARYLHYKSSHHHRNFVAVNCGALTENILEAELFGYEKGAFTGGDPRGKQGFFEAAEGGTVFLDEISELSLNQQKKLLRVLQENEFMRLGGTRPVKNTARLVFAVNRDLKAMMDQGLFREDLYYRINACKISLPPLRERREEIIPLAIFFIRQMIDKYNLKIEAITRSCLDLLMSHNWPGNIRELKNSLNGSLVLFEGGTITEEVFSVLKKNTGSISAGSMVSKPGMQLPEGPFDLNLFIDDIIKATLQKFDGNKSKTAEYLGLSRFQLYRGYKPRS